MPANWENKILKEYFLDIYDQKLLDDAINQSKKYIKINTTSLTEYQILIISYFNRQLKI